MGNTWMVILQFLKPKDMLKSRGLAISHQKKYFLISELDLTFDA